MITLLFPSLSAIREVDRRLIHSGAKKLNWQFLTAKVAPFTSQPFLSLPIFLLSAFFLYSLPPIIFFLLPTSSLYSFPSSPPFPSPTSPLLSPFLLLPSSLPFLQYCLSFSTPCLQITSFYQLNHRVKNQRQTLITIIYGQRHFNAKYKWVTDYYYYYSSKKNSGCTDVCHNCSSECFLPVPWDIFLTLHGDLFVSRLTFIFLIMKYSNVFKMSKFDSNHRRPVVNTVSI